MADLEVMNLFTDKTRPHGHIPFYPNSFAYDRANHSASAAIAQWEQGRAVERLGMFKSLLVYRKKLSRRPPTRAAKQGRP
jgi:hypothetical protein